MVSVFCEYIFKVEIYAEKLFFVKYIYDVIYEIFAGSGIFKKLPGELVAENTL